jgi:hypothetical protein
MEHAAIVPAQTQSVMHPVMQMITMMGMLAILLKVL